MREILFRGKRTDNGEWLEGCLATFKDGDCAIFDPDDEQTPLYQVDPETVGQYTGLTDRNGKKIFESDIMQLSAGTYPCLVYFDGRGFKWLRNNKRIDIDLTFEKMAVIGNIYDNPELVKEQGYEQIAPF